MLLIFIYYSLYTQLTIKVFTLSLEQADVLVAPMFSTNLNSTNVGKALLKKAGQQLKSNFDAAKGKCRITPGDVLEVDGTPLGCKKVFFIECVPWAGNTHNSEQVRGVKEFQCLSFIMLQQFDEALRLIVTNYFYRHYAVELNKLWHFVNSRHGAQLLFR